MQISLTQKQVGIVVTQLQARIDHFEKECEQCGSFDRIMEVIPVIEALKSTVNQLMNPSDR